MSTHVIEYKGALLHVRNEQGVRRYAWLPLSGGRVWKGTENEALELIERLGQMTRGAVLASTMAAPFINGGG